MKFSTDFWKNLRINSFNFGQLQIEKNCNNLRTILYRTVLGVFLYLGYEPVGSAVSLKPLCFLTHFDVVRMCHTCGE